MTRVDDADLRTALRTVAAWGDPPSIPPIPPPSTRQAPADVQPRRPLVALAVAAALLVGVTAIVTRSQPADPSPFADGTWTELAPSPLSPRSDAHGMWTGTSVILMGGDTLEGAVLDGAVYEPADDRWRAIPAPPGPSARQIALTAWTGSEVIALLRHLDSWDYDLVAFDPAAGTWRTLVEARFDHDPPTDALVALGPVPVESPEAMQVVDGQVVLVGWQSSRSRYGWTVLDPATGSWTEPRLFDGSHQLYFFEKASTVVDGQVLFGLARFIGQDTWGVLIDPVLGTEVEVGRPPGAAEAGVHARLASTIDAAVLAGVVSDGEGRSERRAWRLDLDQHRWIDTATPPDGPTADQDQEVAFVGTDDHFVHLGGLDLGAGTTNGGLETRGAVAMAFDPSTARWAALPEPPIDLERVGATAVWTGRGVLVWGGSSATGPLADGAFYEPG